MESKIKYEFEIWPPYEAFYIESMLFNTISAVESINLIFDWIDLSNNLQKLDFEKYSEDQILDNLQNIILHAGSISRYFWPSRDGVKNIHKLRSNKLRTVFEITDDNPLKNRDLRNAIEHFDERLDKYLSNEIVGNVIPNYVGPKQNNDEVPTHFFRAYYTDTVEFELLGDQFNVEIIIKEIIRVHELLEKFTENGYRLKL